MVRPAVAPATSTVETVCPLDCPDACSLSVTLRGGQIAKIDGSTLNDVTRGYICAKVRRFGRRIYGDDRLQYPAVRRGPKGKGEFRRTSWEDALDFVVEKLSEVRARHGAESILPLCYGGSNGRFTQDFADAVFFRRLGASRLLPLLFGALGLATALALDRNVLETLKLGYSIFAAGLILPVLAALAPLKRRVPPKGAISAMAAGGVTAALGGLAPGLLGGHEPVLAGTAVNAAVLLGAWGLYGGRLPLTGGSARHS